MAREKTMNFRKIRTIAGALAMALWSVVPASAHHSFDAEYDSSKPITITGAVTKLDWNNPHAYVYIDVKEAGGAVKNVRVEMGPPYALVRGGWKRDTVKIGDTVTVTGAAAAKDGSNTAGSMQSTSMTLAGGQKLVMR
jgi:predicted lipoprotein